MDDTELTWDYIASIEPGLVGLEQEILSGTASLSEIMIQGRLLAIAGPGAGHPRLRCKRAVRLAYERLKQAQRAWWDTRPRISSSSQNPEPRVSSGRF